MESNKAVDCWMLAFAPYYGQNQRDLIKEALGIDLSDIPLPTYGQRRRFWEYQLEVSDENRQDD